MSINKKPRSRRGSLFKKIDEIIYLLPDGWSSVVSLLDGCSLVGCSLVGCSLVGCSLVGCSVDFFSLVDCSTACFSLFLPQSARLIDTTAATVTGIRNLFIMFIVFYFLSLLRIVAVTDYSNYINTFPNPNLLQDHPKNTCTD